MSAPQVKRTIYDDLVESELARWPGVTWSRQVRGKHYALVLSFNGISRFVIYPVSPSDRRGVLNHINDVKATLRELGAEREAEKRSPRRPRRPPRRDAPPPPLRLTRDEPIRPERDPSRDPWAVLKTLKFEDPEPEPRTLTLLQRFKGIMGLRL